MRSGPLETDPVFVMWLRISRAVLQIRGDELGSALRGLSEARDFAARNEVPLGRATAAFFLVQALYEAGDFEGVEAAAREILSPPEPTGFRSPSATDWTTG